MTETKWTPGPWSEGAIGRVIGPAGNTVADVRYKNGRNDKALIIAAPELYEALEALLALEGNTSPFGGELQADRINRTIDRAIDALRKARGEA